MEDIILLLYIFFSFFLSILDHASGGKNVLACLQQTSASIANGTNFLQLLIIHLKTSTVLPHSEYAEETYTGRMVVGQHSSNYKQDCKVDDTLNGTGGIMLLLGTANCSSLLFCGRSNNSEPAASRNHMKMIMKREKGLLLLLTRFA